MIWAGAKLRSHAKHPGKSDSGSPMATVSASGPKTQLRRADKPVPLSTALDTNVVSIVV
jgi:hypothetical protein